MTIRSFTLPKAKDKINQPSNKWDEGNKSPHGFFSDGPEILVGDIDDCQNRQQIKNDTDLNPCKNGYRVQFYPFKSSETLNTVSTY